MAESDLSAAFGRNNPSPKAQDLFKDREDELQAFETGWAVLRGLVANGLADPEDVESPRHNVLVYYGVGGIGKSTLARELEDRLSDPDWQSDHWPAPDKDVGRVVTARIDLSRSLSLDLEEVILNLRIGMVGVGRGMPSFDLAFARYWAIAHPGEDLETYIARKGLVRRTGDAIKLPDQMSSAVSELASALGESTTAVKLGKQILTVIGKGIRDGAKRHQLLSACPKLVDLLEADASQESLSYYPYLLAWDLRNQGSKDSVSPVIFLDTFEDVEVRGSRTFEKLIQRLVWLLPNALFVITGRNRLDWEDERLIGSLDHVGRNAWPGLSATAEKEPRQHLVGNLSFSDALSFLEARAAAELPQRIDDSLLRFIAKRSDGWPIYLDTAVMRLVSIAREREPLVSDFEIGFPALVGRVFQDLPNRERDALRSASLLSAWDPSLVAKGAGQATESASSHLTARPLVQELPQDIFPFRIHDAVREAIREADHGLPDSWTANDWTAAAERLIERLGELAMEPNAERDLLLRCLEMGVSLADEFDLRETWLDKGVESYVIDNRWESLRPELGGTGELPDPQNMNQAQATFQLIELLGERQREDRRKVLNRLEDLANGAPLGRLSQMLSIYYQSEIYRDLGSHEESEHLLSQVVSREDPEHPSQAARLAQVGRWHLLKRRGKFADVLRETSTHDPTPAVERIKGDAHWMQGSFELAVGDYARANALALKDGLLGSAAESAVCGLFAAAWRTPGAAADQIAEVSEALDAANIQWAKLQFEVAKILSKIEPNNGGLVLNELDLLKRRASDRGYVSIQMYCGFLAAFSGAVNEDPLAVEVARNDLLGSIQGIEFAWILDVVGWWMVLSGSTNEPRPSSSSVDWSVGIDSARIAWEAAVMDRRDG